MSTSDTWAGPEAACACENGVMSEYELQLRTCWLAGYDDAPSKAHISPSHAARANAASFLT